MDAASLTDRVAEAHRGKKFIVAMDVAAPAVATASRLREWGALDVLVIAAERGAGPLDEEIEVAWVEVPPSDTVMGAIRSFERFMRTPPREIITMLDRFDPAHDATVITAPFLAQDGLLGRPVSGARRKAWVDLENKVTVDALWEAAGIPHAPSEVVSPVDAPEAARRLASELGTVWAADNSRGWHGGGNSTRWVPDPGAAVDAVDFFSEIADEVRVMPFLDGIPCSIHGIVTARGVAVTRPVEIVIMRTDPPGFYYGGVSQSWDPPPEIREEMRAAARAVARVLSERVGYLGPFGIDGVCTRRGFVPHELNPRSTGGVAVLARSLPDVPLDAAFRLLIDGVLDVDPEGLEALIVGAADSNRIASFGAPVPKALEPQTVHLDFADGQAREVEESARSGWADIGPGPLDSFVRFTFDPGQFEIGRSVAPFAVATLEFIDRRWDVGIPRLSPAPDVFAP
jgi:predicted ATP-grasp superfamily ATP-dependent carboligase